MISNIRSYKTADSTYLSLGGTKQQPIRLLLTEGRKRTHLSDEVVGVGGKLAYIRAYYCFKG